MGDDYKKSQDDGVISRFVTSITRLFSGNYEKEKRNDFDGQVLIVDNSELHIRGIRALIKEVFEIDENYIHASLTRTEALKIAGSIDSKLLLISDVYTHSDMNAVEFVKSMKALEKRIYTAICTGNESKALQEMPELGPSGDLVRAFINRYTNVEDSFKAIFDDFIDGPWEQPSEKGHYRLQIDSGGADGRLANDTGADSNVLTSAEKSPEANSLDAHTWEEADLFLPEERKTYLSKCVIAPGESLLRSFKKFELSSGDYDLTTDKEGSIEALVCEAGRFAADIDKPVSKELIRKVNRGRTKEKQLSMEDAKNLYFCRDTRALFDAMHDFDIEKSQKSVKKIVEELETHVNNAKDKLQEMGGDSEQTLVRVLGGYDIDTHSKWHEELFGRVEMHLYSEVLKMLMARFQIPVEEIRVDDRGCGTGRCFKQLIRLITEGLQSEDGGSQEFPILTDSQKIRTFALNYHGIDIIRENVKKTRQAIKDVICPDGGDPEKDNIVVGDFHDILPMEKLKRYQPGTIDFSICMMRTVLHNITKGQFINFLCGIEADLKPGTEDRPGGMALIDTVMMRGLSGENMGSPEEAREAFASLSDLKNLYTQLFLSYADRNQRFMPEGVDLRRMPRRPISDNTTTCGFYQREVIGPMYIRHILNEGNIDLEVQRSIRKFPVFTEKGESGLKREEAVRLGRRWIKDNELEDRYREEIKKRIDDSITRPSELLSREVAEGEDVIELLLDYVAYHMTTGFGGEYIILQRPQKKKESDADAEKQG
jgi:hypothetical protein